jgi:2-amino-4-hydroxy-6-hydroxymethyldihydropteridine diphosphokinase
MTANNRSAAPRPVVIALGSNLGDRRRYLREAIHRLRSAVSIVRLSSLWETDPVDAPAGSPPFLNMVLAGVTSLSPTELLETILGIETAMGRRRRESNGPRPIDLDLILYDAHQVRSPALTLPHPRYRKREFVLAPLRELGLRWRDPATGAAIDRLRGEGRVLLMGPL